MSLTATLQALAEALTTDSEIESTCTTAWGRSLRVYRRVGELYIPEADQVPMVQIQSGPRGRDGHYNMHGIAVVVFAGGMAQPTTTDNITYSADEDDAESLFERVEVVTMQSFGDQGVAAQPAEPQDDVITGPYLIAAYNFNIYIRNVIPL